MDRDGNDEPVRWQIGADAIGEPEASTTLDPDLNPRVPVAAPANITINADAVLLDATFTPPQRRSIHHQPMFWPRPGLIHSRTESGPAMPRGLNWKIGSNPTVQELTTSKPIT